MSRQALLPATDHRADYGSIAVAPVVTIVNVSSTAAPIISSDRRAYFANALSLGPFVHNLSVYLHPADIARLHQVNRETNQAIHQLLTGPIPRPLRGATTPDPLRQALIDIRAAIVFLRGNRRRPEPELERLLSNNYAGEIARRSIQSNTHLYRTHMFYNRITRASTGCIALLVIILTSLVLFCRDCTDWTTDNPQNKMPLIMTGMTIGFSAILIANLFLCRYSIHRADSARATLFANNSTHANTIITREAVEAAERAAEEERRESMRGLADGAPF